MPINQQPIIHIKHKHAVSNARLEFNQNMEFQNAPCECYRHTEARKG